ncbi:LOW QUALITY PROTEIN: probable ATP-dependent RNA helicase DDX46 [Xenia sp. Carnegie-2017]|uniref:LOW QUALITY PROTEIN: probable ATP-dependent RNA helicase DDX46 n=1 Tax=Xenia sp. Carnegie-2017 TaxID=2897299 RepID=UPI001F046E4B|nr:LOW QUALITY PROTEIN: probable ATP-dependent RNA helicase DDX46 [Xenia sp. Carnegie-2017]
MKILGYFSTIVMPSDSRKRHRSRDRSPRRRRSRSRSNDRSSRKKEKFHRKRKHSSSSSSSSSPDREKRERLRRSRSKDRSKKRARSRTRSLEKKKKINKDDSRHEKTRDKNEESVNTSKKNDDKKDEAKKDSTDKDYGQKNLEEEMKKRKERIENWRKQRKAETEEKEATSNKESELNRKGWTLEDDEEDDAEPEDVNQENGATGNDNAEAMQEEEIDPLDAFMVEVDQQVSKQKQDDDKRRGLLSLRKAKQLLLPLLLKNRMFLRQRIKRKSRGELMANDQDAMEYSSEEEKEDILADPNNIGYKTKPKKELAAVDHTKVYYQPFRKNFYVEVPELAKLTPEEVEVMLQDLENIKVKGKDAPKPIKSWAQAGLSLKIMEVLKKCNYEKPTPIQAQAIPCVMSGRDMIGIAKTGSGKTLAFLIPMLRHVLDQPVLERDDGPIAIIMTPTRELALQIHREAKKFCKPLLLRVTCVYGGTGISEQIAELKRGAEIIVCTPGRMIDMLTANNGRVTNCRRCTYLVLDEADRMFDMGFEPQVTKILDCIRPDRQTVLFSATFPRQMEALARKILTKPVEVQVGGRSVVCSDVDQNAVIIEEDDKFLKLLELLGVYQEQGSILVFVEKQESADSLLKDLLKRSYPCLSLHGGMDQFDRDSTIADFKNGTIKLMVATSVAARGLDVKQLVLVINYDCPNHYEDYVHRCGRTGRAGNKGTSYTFITPEQGKFTSDIVKAFELSGTEAPEDLKSFLRQYKEERKAEGKSIVKNSGFSGKGFKFDENEKNQANEAKKMQKWALGLQDSDDEAEAADKAVDQIDKDIAKAFSNKPTLKKAGAIIPPIPNQNSETIKGAQKAKLNLAASIAAKINEKISSGNSMDMTQQATSKIMKGEAVSKMSGLGLAKQLAEKVNNKLNYIPVEPEKEEETTSDDRYEDEIEINSFPQQARWKITSKDTLSQITEYSEAAVTVRGTYVAPGTQPPEGERKIYLYIEGPTERAVQIAKLEIKRVLKEELLRQSAYHGPQPTGRYKVI